MVVVVVVKCLPGLCFWRVSRSSRATSAAPLACCTQGLPCPIDLSLLRQEPSLEHKVRSGDVLGVYIEGIVSGAEFSSGGGELPAANYNYRQDGDQPQEWPAVGQPFAVATNGSVKLPLIGPVSVAGLSTEQASTAIRAAYVDAGRLNKDPNTSFVQTSVIRSRTNRVLVVREDSPVQAASLIQRDQYVLSKRGEAAVVDLVPHESDVLHALVATGGLPGEDAKNEVWILRGGSPLSWQEATDQFDQGITPDSFGCGDGSVVVIPIRYNCDAPLPFNREDVLLQDGDVVFVEKRVEAHFYTGGLLNAGRIPLPRDEDIDVLEAVALANAGIWGCRDKLRSDSRDSLVADLVISVHPPACR